MSKKNAQEMIADLMAKRWSLTVIADRLDQKGYPCSLGNLSRVKNGKLVASQNLEDGIRLVHAELKKG